MGREAKGERGWRAGLVRESYNSLYFILDFLHGEKKMQLHVPSQPFQARRGEGK